MGNYKIVAADDLEEDIAGNRINEALDHDAGASSGSGDKRFYEIPFSVAVSKETSNSRFRNSPKVSLPGINHLQASLPGKRIRKPRKIVQTENCCKETAFNRKAIR